MLQLYTRKKIKVNVPENIAEDKSTRFTIEDIKKAKNYYDENGYVIFSKCVEPVSCDFLRNLWDKSIKQYNGKIYRQTTGKAEKNIFNENKWIMNPILNIQSLNPKLFKNFREDVEQTIFKNKNICSILSNFFNKKPKIIQSMYFEGNSITGEHQDTYYFDSEKIGILTAAWIALEEIKADAGRFFICPGSHKIDIKKMKYYDRILSSHDLYIDELISICNQNNLTLKAPFMDKGDVLFWNSKTLHGSLNSQSKKYSRSSMTLHAIPENHKFLHWHKHYIDTPVDDLGDSLIYRRKDQKLIKNRIVFMFESYFPNLFYLLKKKIAQYFFNQKHY